MKKKIDLSKMKKSEEGKISKILSERVNKPVKTAKEGVDLIGLAKTLAKRHVEKIKKTSDDEESEDEE